MSSEYAWPKQRKAHVHVDQDRYVEVLAEVGGSARLEDIAAFFDVSEASARRQLDGLAYQGRVRVVRRRPSEYALAHWRFAGNA